MGIHLSFDQKEEIIQYKKKCKKTTHAQLKCYFDEKFKKNIGLRTIGDILKNEESILAAAANTQAGTKKIVQPAYPDLEKALELWCDNQEAINNHITEVIIIYQAALFAEELNIENYSM